MLGPPEIQSAHSMCYDNSLVERTALETFSAPQHIKVCASLGSVFDARFSKS
jgi:hypothetical protein